MDEYGKARISQCMIVKNEEKNSERALSWGKGIVSEQIVVDTGSTDRTVELAKQMGARVYHFEWIDDFAAAKNYAISKARYEWIALLDADEYFLENDARKLLAYIQELQDTDYDIILSSWVHLDNAGGVMAVGTQTRVFRNKPGLKYLRRIHEYLTPHFRMVDGVNELPIYHTGYGREETARKQGSKRNRKLILQELEEHPDDWEMMGYLGDEYYASEEMELAEETFRKVTAWIPEKDVDEIRVALNFEKLLELLLFKGDETDEADFMDIYERAVKRLPQEADFDYYAGKFFANRMKFDKAEGHLKRAVELIEAHGNESKSMMLSARMEQTYELLAVCCFNSGNLADCVKYTAVLLNLNKYLMSTLYLMISAFYRDRAEHGAQAADAASVAAFLGQSFYDWGSLKDRLFVLRAAMSSGYGELVEIIRGMFTPEELAQVDSALGADTR